MLKKIKRNLKEFLVMIIFALIVFWGFLVYLHFIGIPKTSARNYYNLAVIEFDKGNKEKALEYLDIAEEHWAEGYIIEFREKISQ